MIEPTSPAAPVRDRRPITDLVFSCGRCRNPSRQAGRRKRFVNGLHTWVCAACVDREAKP